MSCVLEILPVPIAATLIRLLGAFLPKTEAGTMVGKLPIIRPPARAPLVLDRMKSLLLMAFFFGSIRDGLKLFKVFYCRRFRYGRIANDQLVTKNNAIEVDVVRI